MAASLGRHSAQRHALGAVLRSAFTGHEPATCLLGICEALADMVEDERLPDADTAGKIIADMTAQTVTDRAMRRWYEAKVARAGARS